jgi:hypothetical protein
MARRESAGAEAVDIASPVGLVGPDQINTLCTIRLLSAQQRDWRQGLPRQARSTARRDGRLTHPYLRTDLNGQALARGATSYCAYPIQKNL